MTDVHRRHVFGAGVALRGRDRQRPRPVPRWLFFLLLWLAVTVCAVVLQLAEA
jgi:hypothetical protein